MKIALGLFDMLGQAIDDHQREHQGDRPVRFELHLTLRAELFSDTRLRWSTEINRPDGKEMFMGVELRWTTTAKYPRMLTARHELEEL